MSDPLSGRVSSAVNEVLNRIEAKGDKAKLEQLRRESQARQREYDGTHRF